MCWEDAALQDGVREPGLAALSIAWVGISAVSRNPVVPHSTSSDWEHGNIIVQKAQSAIFQNPVGTILSELQLHTHKPVTSAITFHL